MKQKCRFYACEQMVTPHEYVGSFYCEKHKPSLMF